MLSDALGSEVIGFWAPNCGRQPGVGLEHGKCLWAEPVRLDSAESLGDCANHQLVNGECLGGSSSRGDAPSDENFVLMETTGLEHRRIRVVELVDGELETARSLRDLSYDNRRVSIHDQEGGFVNGVS